MYIVLTPYVIQPGLCDIVVIMKLKIRIHEVAKSRGLTTAYQLQKLAGLTAPNAYKIFNNNIVQISIETLGKLCDVLDCEPSDLFVRPKAASGRHVRSKVKG